jgi:hypothetical protein
MPVPFTGGGDSTGELAAASFAVEAHDEAVRVRADDEAARQQFAVPRCAGGHNGVTVHRNRRVGASRVEASPDAISPSQDATTTPSRLRRHPSPHRSAWRPRRQCPRHADGGGSEAAAHNASPPRRCVQPLPARDTALTTHAHTGPMPPCVLTAETVVSRFRSCPS